jgi:hypothetical protein
MLYMQMTVDGFIAGPKLGWMSENSPEIYDDFVAIMSDMATGSHGHGHLPGDGRLLAGSREGAVGVQLDRGTSVDGVSCRVNRPRCQHRGIRLLEPRLSIGDDRTTLAA